MAVLTTNTTSLGVLGIQNECVTNYMTDSQIRELKRSIDEQRYLYDQMNREAQMMKSRCDEVNKFKASSARSLKRSLAMCCQN